MHVQLFATRCALAYSGGEQDVTCPGPIAAGLTYKTVSLGDLVLALYHRKDRKADAADNAGNCVRIENASRARGHMQIVREVGRGARGAHENEQAIVCKSLYRLEIRI